MYPLVQAGLQSGMSWQVFVDESQYWLVPHVTGHWMVPPQPSLMVPHWYDWHAVSGVQQKPEMHWGPLKQVLPPQHGSPFAPQAVQVPAEQASKGDAHHEA